MKRNYEWFDKRRKTKGLEIAYEQISKAVDTVSLLHQATKRYSEGNATEAKKNIEKLFKTEEEVDKLRTFVFKELSKGVALIADYREVYPAAVFSFNDSQKFVVIRVVFNQNNFLLPGRYYHEVSGLVQFY